MSLSKEIIILNYTVDNFNETVYFAYAETFLCFKWWKRAITSRETPFSYTSCDGNTYYFDPLFANLNWEEVSYVAFEKALKKFKEKSKCQPCI